MSIKLSTTDISKIYLGTTEIQKAYLGATEVFTVNNLWTPSQITTLGWWDFNDHDSMTLNGSNVALVPDLSTNADKDMIQNTDANRPILSTLNGKNAIRFDSALKSLSGGLVGDFNGFHDGSGASFFYVVNFDSTTQFLKEFFTTVDGNNGIEARLRQETTNLALFCEENNVVLHNWTSGSGTLALETDIIFALTTGLSQTNDTKAWLNGVNTKEVNYSATPTGGYNSNNLRLGGDCLHTVGEILLLDNVPDDATRQLIEGYLAWKWGLEGSLEIGHPYKDSAPTI